ncbi:MAG: hypothetical protein Q9187_007901 [Circinaria calcarea]
MSRIVQRDDRIRLLEFHSQKEDTQESCQYLNTSLRNGPPFDAVACMPGKEDDLFEVSFKQQPVISEAFQKALLLPRSIETPRYFWIETLCVDQNCHQEKTRHARLLKDIYSTARSVIIWAGTDHEDDCFEHYLGRGTHQTTEHAFEFAHLLATVAVSDISKVLRQKFPKTGIQSWAYLTRICYRPFFRGLPLLRTNYVEDLPSLTVQCSISSIPWPTLKKAAQRLLIAHPIPYFLLRASIPTTEDDTTLFKADREYLLLSLRFGLELARISAQNYCLFEEESPHRSRYLAHLGFCNDVYDFTSMDQFVLHYKAIKASNVTGEEPVDEEMYKSPPPLASLPSEGRQSPPPIAEDQAPFVHTHINRKAKLHLLVILPDTDLSAPLQCALVETKKADDDFAFILNHTFLRRPLPERNQSGLGFPVTTRSTSTVLVNNQAYVIPRLQEIFLRLIRDPADERWIFMWNLCMRPDEAGLHNREDVEMYIKAKNYMQSVRKAEAVDMYEILDRAGENTSKADLERLGCPDHMEWDDWLLELND